MAFDDDGDDLKQIFLSSLTKILSSGGKATVDFQHHSNREEFLTFDD